MILVECCDYDGSVALESFDNLMEAETAVEEVVKAIPDHPDTVSYKCVEIFSGVPVAEHTYCMDLINRDWKWGSRPLINDSYMKKWKKIRKELEAA